MSKIGWERYLAGFGAQDWHDLPPQTQDRLVAGFAARQRRQAALGRVIAAGLVITCLLSALLVATSRYWLAS